MNYIVLDDIGDFGTFSIKEVACVLAEQVGGQVFEFEGESFDWENEHMMKPIYTGKNYKRMTDEELEDYQR
jgi:hypothetical protein